MSPLLYYFIFLKSAYNLIIILFIYFRLLFIYAKEEPTIEDHSYRFTNNEPTPIYPNNIQVKSSEEKRPPPKHLSILVNKNNCLNLILPFIFLISYLPQMY